MNVEEFEGDSIKARYWKAILLLRSAAIDFEEDTGESMKRSTRTVYISRDVCFALHHYAKESGQEDELFNHIGYSFTVRYCWHVAGFKCVLLR